jgi:hypothetical protein
MSEIVASPIFGLIASDKGQQKVPMRKCIRSLRRERVVLTGGMWIRRAKIQNQVRRRGGVVDTSVNVTTTVLVRGESPNWKYGDHGLKERQAVHLIRRGSFISLVLESEFRKLLEKRKPARVADRIAGEPVRWLAPATRWQFKRVARINGSLDREHTALGRVEQSYLRHILFGTTGRMLIVWSPFTYWAACCRSRQTAERVFSTRTTRRRKHRVRCLPSRM